MIRKRKRNENDNNDESDYWIQCNLCLKWRSIKLNTIITKDKPNQWYCSMNTNIEYSKCDIDEEIIIIDINNENTINDEENQNNENKKKQIEIDKQNNNDDIIIKEEDISIKLVNENNDDTIELLNFAFDIDNGVIELPKNELPKKIEKIKKETLTVPNPTSVKKITKSNAFYQLEGSFPQILHQIIVRECKNNIVTWSVDGNSFHISDFTYFLSNICSHYFEKISYQSFRRYMKIYGFEIIEGKNLNINERTNTRTYFHPKFQRDNYEMTKEIIRIEQKNNKINSSKKEIIDDNGITIDGVDIIDNYEKDHEIDRPNFFRDIQEMMFGFGDSWPPNKNATLLIDRLVTTYITELAQRAEIVAETTGKLDKECFLYLVRKDEFKFTRVMKLINTNEQLKNIKKQSINNDDDDDNDIYNNADY